MFVQTSKNMEKDLDLTLIFVPIELCQKIANLIVTKHTKEDRVRLCGLVLYLRVRHKLFELGLLGTNMKGLEHQSSTDVWFNYNGMPPCQDCRICQKHPF